MTGYREKIADDAQRILLESDNMSHAINAADAHVLREAWTCSKHGNILIDVIEDMLYNNFSWYCTPRDTVDFAIRQQGFLTTHEKWHSARARGRKTRVYRGCGRGEIDDDDLGLSWTLSRDVADFFASRSGGDSIIVADARIDCWLDTAEHECIICANEHIEIVSIDAPQKVVIDWSDRPRLRPGQHC